MGNMLPTQAPVEQQPAEHESASQMQLPDAHRVPAPHAAAVPQRQVPVAPSHESALVDEQAIQAWPPIPQALGEAEAQVVPFRQQPLGQEAASHTQAPATQLLPALHAARAPHWQAPVLPHMSERAGSQVTQAAPPPPQVIGPAWLQVGPEQQPAQFPELHALQMPPVHGPPPQSWHWAPPLPHSAESVPGWQVFPWQHPVEHDVESQTHVPITQRSPCGQADPVPHWQSPAAEQRSALMSHFMHATPPIPQLATARARQTLPAQQPDPHDVASQTHFPPRHRWPAPQAALAPQAQPPAALHESATVELHD